MGGENAADQNTAEDDAVIAATREWIEKAVIGLNLCPFARAVHSRDQIRYVVSRATTVDALMDDLDREVIALGGGDPDEVDTTLLIHPEVLQDFLDYNDFLELAEKAPADNELEGVIQVASFHPQYQFEGTSPDDVSNFTNRSPYPTLHLLREESVTRAVDSHPDAQGIPDRNVETLDQLGIAGWRAIWKK